MSEKAAKAKRQLQDQSQARWEAQRHRAEVQRCATCAYLEEIDAQVAQDGAVVMVRGQCRLLPPTMNAAPVPVQQSALAGAQTSIGFVRESEWVLVLGDWGCGQHRPRRLSDRHMPWDGHGLSTRSPADSGERDILREQADAMAAETEAIERAEDEGK